MEARVGIEPAYAELQALVIRSFKIMFSNGLQDSCKVMSTLISCF